MAVFLLILALFLFTIAGLLSIGDLEGGPQPHTLLYFGLASWVLAELVGGAGAVIARWRSQ